MSQFPTPFPYRAVSFDMDGTLYSLERFKVQLIVRGLRDLRFWRAMERVRRTIRRGGIVDTEMSTRIEEAVSAEVGLDRAEVAATVERLVHVQWPSLLARVGPHRHVRELLEALVAAELPIVLVSDYPCAAKAEALGLGDLPWVGTLDATELGALKPRPEVYQAALEALGLPAPDVLHVGDSMELDVVGAAGVGMATALVRPPTSPPPGVRWAPATHAFSSVPKFCKAALSALTP